MKTTLKRWGNSQGVRIPKSMVDSLGMDIGSQLVIALSEDSSMVTITPAKDARPIRGRHRIEDLIATGSPNAFVGEYDWGGPEGKEVW